LEVSEDISILFFNNQP